MDDIMVDNLQTYILNEPVAVLARFEAGRAIPVRFRLGRRTLTVGRITRQWMHCEDGSRQFYYALFADDRRFWQLAFETRDLRWTAQRCR